MYSLKLELLKNNIKIKKKLFNIIKKKNLLKINNYFYK